MNDRPLAVKSSSSKNDGYILPITPNYFRFVCRRKGLFAPISDHAGFAGRCWRTVIMGNSCLLPCQSWSTYFTIGKNFGSFYVGDNTCLRLLPIRSVWEKKQNHGRRTSRADENFYNRQKTWEIREIGEDVYTVGKSVVHIVNYSETIVNYWLLWHKQYTGWARTAWK